jgi:succinoglycan biosynthesis transport protein ExoP
MNARSARFQALATRAKTVPPGNDFDAIETRSLLRALWQGRWKVGGLALGVGALVWVAMLQITPTFTVYSKLMLDTRKVQIIGGNEVVADVAPSEQIVNSEIGVLQSNMVTERMLSGLTPQQRDQLDPALQPKSLIARVKGSIKGLLSAPAAPTDDTDAREARLIDAVRGIRTAYAQPDSYVMVIRVDSSDPTLARDVANGLADAYITLQLENRRSGVVRATDWLEEQIISLRAQVEQSESAVAEFRAQSLIADGGTLENVSQQLGDLNAQLASIRTARVESESRLSQLTDMFAAQNVAAAAAVINTPAMQELAAQQLKLRQDDAVWARTYDATQSRRVEIQTKLDEVQAAMQVELQNAIAVARSDVALARNRESGITDGIRTLEVKVMDMTANQIGLRQLNREADAARQTYESFLSRIAETRAQRELQQADSVLVERALLPQVPSAPRPTLLATLAMTVTLALSAAWMLFREMAPITYRSPRELAAATGLPVLTTLPDEGWNDLPEMLADLRQNPHSAYADRIRQLRTAMTLRRPTVGRGQSVLLLGASPGDGKTATALALTQLAVLSGRTAIIVDCDLRNPRILTALSGRTRPAHDFGDFIEYRCDLPEAIYSPTGFTFDVLGARDPLHSGADALSSTWLAQVLRELERCYDLVIIDAPALLAVPDALIVAQEVETNFFVVGCDQTSRDAVQRGLATLAELGIEVHGLILNKVGSRKTVDPLQGGIGYDDWLNRTRRAVPAKRNWLLPAARPARGNHPLLAGWNAWWRKGA